MGQSFPALRLLTVTVHWCPLAHLHGRFLWLNCVTVVGSNSASTARSGRVVARSLYPGSTDLPLQTGQPFPLLRSLTRADHSWPRAHRQSTLLLLNCVTVVGSNSASTARSGRVVARSLYPGSTDLPLQTGQPFPAFRLAAVDSHSWPRAHRHGRFLFDEPAVTAVGSNKASAARRGCVVAKSLKPGNTAWPAQNGHPRPLERSAAVAVHSCPDAHRQGNFLPLDLVMVRASNCASAANSGFVVSRSL